VGEADEIPLSFEREGGKFSGLVRGEDISSPSSKRAGVRVNTK